MNKITDFFGQLKQPGKLHTKIPTNGNYDLYSRTVGNKSGLECDRNF